MGDKNGNQTGKASPSVVAFEFEPSPILVFKRDEHFFALSPTSFSYFIPVTSLQG